MMHKKMFVIAVIVVFVLAAAVWFAPSIPAGGTLKNGVAIVMRSWSDTFNPASDDFLASEITIQGDASSSAPLGDGGLFSESATDGTPQEIPAGNDSSGDSQKATPISTSTPQETAVPEIPHIACTVSTTSAASAASLSHKIVFNEIAWMGSLSSFGETASKASNREWMELKNTSGTAIDLSGWKMLDSSGNIAIAFESGDTITAGGFYVAARGDDAAPELHADKTYAGALPNAGDTLFLFDDDCALSDVLNASAGWSGGDNTTKQTLERSKDDAGGWHTSALAGGTPHAENSAVPPPGVAGGGNAGGGGNGNGGGDTGGGSISNGGSSQASSSSGNVSGYTIAVTLRGDGRGVVTSTPPGVVCGVTCSWNFSAGNTVTLRATPDTASAFAGWFGACTGTGNTCTIAGAASASIAVTATFNLLSTGALTDSTSSSTATSTSSTTPTSTIATATTTTVTTTTPTPAAQKIVIAAVQIAGASTTNDFVKLFNPGPDAVDLGGWKLRKKASTGSDQSLRQFPGGSTIASHGYFVWANSDGGFSGSLGADVSSTATLAADNSVAFFDANGVMMDAVAWGTGVDPYAEGCPYPTDPAADQVLRRIFRSGAIMDTDNNADDFTL